jgi:hypothetical protein
MAEKHGHSFDGYTCEQKLNRECIAEAVGVAVWNKRDLKESLKPPSPIRNGALNLTDARPEPISAARHGRLFKRIQYDIRQNQVHGDTRLLRIEK